MHIYEITNHTVGLINTKKGWKGARSARQIFTWFFLKLTQNHFFQTNFLIDVTLIIDKGHYHELCSSFKDILYRKVLHKMHIKKTIQSALLTWKIEEMRAKRAANFLHNISFKVSQDHLFPADFCCYNKESL